MRLGWGKFEGYPKRCDKTTSFISPVRWNIARLVSASRVVPGCLMAPLFR